MTKRVLVTGGTGLIGRHVAPQLAARGYEVIALSARARPVAAGEHEVVASDLRDQAAIAGVLRSVQASHLLHIAWRPAVAGLWGDRENIAWVRHSLGLVEGFLEAGGQRATLVGSCAEYDWAGGLCREAGTPLEPATLYGKCKRAAHLLADSAFSAAGASLAWARVFFVYGPGEHESRLGASVIQALSAGTPAETTHGLQLRDYMHAQDVGDGLVAVLDSTFEGAVNVATGVPVRVRDVVEEIGRQIGRPDLIRLGARAAPAYEPPLILADATVLRETIGFTPRFDLTTGIADTLAAFRAPGAD